MSETYYECINSIAEAYCEFYNVESVWFQSEYFWALMER